MITGLDLGSGLDQALVGFYVFFIFTGSLANKLNVPFLTRDGGLITYSKFASGVSFGPNVSTRNGMMFLYTPGILIALYFFVQIGIFIPAAIMENRGALMAVLIAVHFAKRVFESAFVHKYSGTMPVTTCLTITSLYAIMSPAHCYYAQLAPPFKTAPGELLRSIGLVLYVVGILGNFYHHYLLATLRKPGETGYKVPHGGFFDLLGGVATPHYFFELIEWLGVALVSQHVNSFMLLVGMFLYLADRATAQTEWSKTALKDEYPKTRKHMIPMLF